MQLAMAARIDGIVSWPQHTEGGNKIQVFRRELVVTEEDKDNTGNADYRKESNGPAVELAHRGPCFRCCGSINHMRRSAGTLSIARAGEIISSSGAIRPTLRSSYEVTMSFRARFHRSVPTPEQS